MTSLRKRGLLCALEDFTFWTRDDLGAPQRESCGRHLLTSIGSSALLEMTKFLSRPQRPFSLCNSVRLCRCRIRRFCVLDTRRDSALDQRNEGPQDWRTANCPDYMYDSPNVVGFCANSNRWSCFSAQRNGRGIQSIRRTDVPMTSESRYVWPDSATAPVPAPRFHWDAQRYTQRPCYTQRLRLASQSLRR